MIETNIHLQPLTSCLTDNLELQLQPEQLISTRFSSTVLSKVDWDSLFIGCWGVETLLLVDYLLRGALTCNCFRWWIEKNQTGTEQLNYWQDSDVNSSTRIYYLSMSYISCFNWNICSLFGVRLLARQMILTLEIISV